MLAKRNKEVDMKLVQELEAKGWGVADLNSQLYQILCDCAVAKSMAQ